MMNTTPALKNLIQTVARLRGRNGCPWDSQQTHESLVPYLVEEVYELIEAIESGNSHHLIEELGDVLYQVIFHTQIAKDSAEDPFDLDDVAAAVEKKMRSRHPHVFADLKSHSSDEALEQWERIKREQKKDRTSSVDGIPQPLSALSRADSLLKRSKYNLKLRGKKTPIGESEMELGNLLLEIVFSARSKGFDSERALRAVTRDLERKIRSEERANAEWGPSV